MKHCIICGDEEVRTEGLRIGIRKTGEYVYLCEEHFRDEESCFWAFQNFNDLIEGRRVAVPA